MGIEKVCQNVSPALFLHGNKGQCLMKSVFKVILQDSNYMNDLNFAEVDAYTAFIAI